MIAVAQGALVTPRGVQLRIKRLYQPVAAIEGLYISV
jgi:hypothetical protein